MYLDSFDVYKDIIFLFLYAILIFVGALYSFRVVRFFWNYYRFFKLTRRYNINKILKEREKEEKQILKKKAKQDKEDEFLERNKEKEKEKELQKEREKEIVAERSKTLEGKVSYLNEEKVSRKQDGIITGLIKLKPGSWLHMATKGKMEIFQAMVGSNAKNKEFWQHQLKAQEKYAGKHKGRGGPGA